MDCMIAVAGDEEVCATVRRVLEEQGCASVPMEHARWVFTFEPSQSGQEELYFGDEGVLKRVQPGTTLVELSAAVPSFAREVYQLASVYGCQAVAAPLIVKDPVAEDAFGTRENLMAVCGGERAACDEAAPLLRALASQLLVVGDCAEAQAFKAAHSVDAAAGIAGAVEAVGSLKALAPEADLEDLVDVLVSSGAIAPAHEALVEAVIEERLEGTYTASLLMADLAMALSALEESDTIMPQADAAFHLLELLAVTGGGNLSPAALSLMFGDEDAAKRHQLDWSGAAAYYGGDEDDGEDGCWDEDCDCDHDHEHAHGHRGEDDTVFGFSAN